MNKYKVNYYSPEFKQRVWNYKTDDILFSFSKYLKSQNIDINSLEKIEISCINPTQKDRKQKSFKFTSRAPKRAI